MLWNDESRDFYGFEKMFCMYQFGQNLHYSHGLLFSRNFWMELKRMPLSI